MRTKFRNIRFAYANRKVQIGLRLTNIGRLIFSSRKKYRKLSRRSKQNMQKLLSEFAVGERGVIKTVSGERKIRRRLFDMGVTPGADVLLKKKAPLGDPLEITIRGYELTLRKSEAACVTMETEKC